MTTPTATNALKATHATTSKDYTESDALADALAIAIVETKRKLVQAQRHIRKLEEITNNRKPGDGYVSQEQLLRVIDRWTEDRKRWYVQLEALQNLVFDLQIAGHIK